MELLRKIEAKRLRQREELRLEVRRRLSQALQELMPGQRVLLFGSLTRPHQFHRRSDVDLALFEAPRDRSVFRLQAQLEEAVGRPVDLILLEESRFKTKLQAEGELWTN